MVDPNFEVVPVGTAAKVKMYEGLLHDLQMYREVAMDNEKIIRLLNNICHWSYCHRRGNGELTEQEQQALIDRAFANLRTVR